jgi:hypothetical protein
MCYQTWNTSESWQSPNASLKSTDSLSITRHSSNGSFLVLGYLDGQLEFVLMYCRHLSDCAVHNEPAYPAGECDCGHQLRVERRYASLFLCLAISHFLRLGTRYRSWVWREFQAPVEFSSPVARWIRLWINNLNESD